ncbi:C40 family peptidase [Ureibacillus acetophenoni]|uniref:Cell wall-associated NlpC family hydrolase n=1 Tax=Ureibacillus acetophenoni TaxID=614649 RepID=A0A285ULH3_9BACL|nr:C40 family peptidase [Ureibacillus acetophenoni]SOC42764.1 cell wall-associated NlpC family hydrolase [Ureibacillus acetophenoni]
MSLSLRVPKLSVLFLSVLSVIALLLFTLAPKASATINYGEEVSAVAKTYVESPYEWGGTTPKGFDASGFTQYVYKNAATKMNIPRTSALQYKMGESVKDSELQAGDLVFYETGEKGKVSFVGIYNGDGTFTGVTISGVKIVKMSDQYWKDRYVGAKRIVK